jgi:acetyl esterase
VYFHGGGFCFGSIGLMDPIARELAHRAGAVVVSVGYRLAPEHPYPAGLDDCEAVTRWVQRNTTQLGVPRARVAVAGESAGGNLATAVALRLRGAAEPLAGQVLMYPTLAGGPRRFRSRDEFDGIVLSAKASQGFWDAYSGSRDLSRDPFAVPLTASSLAKLPPALIVLGGCDPVRDEGRLYGARLRADRVEVEEYCVPGQPHGFINLGLPAAEDALARVGAWLRSTLAQER